VALVGPDALGFLQSLASQDLADLPVGASRHSLLLEPQGKLTADFVVVRVADDELWLRCEPDVAPLLAAGLARFKIRVKVEIEDRSEGYAAVVLRGPAALDAVPAYPAGVHRIERPWADVPGVELVGPAATIVSIEPDAPQATIEDLEVLRIELGVPRQPVDIDERTIAQEAGLERTAVSFTKGCFLGQELVCRIDSRGRVTRTLRRLRPTAPVEVGAEVRTADGTVVGTVSSAEVSPRVGPVALATLRHDVAPGAELRIDGIVTTPLD
jgi:folate-binding protein YgfZ